MQLILGGARSGKSRVAEERALAWAQAQSGRKLIYIATAVPGDTEMAQRIACHRAGRDAQWQVIECPQQLAQTISEQLAPDTWVLVDCLTLWISNCLHSGSWPGERDNLLALTRELAHKPSSGELILVSNEVGSGIVPLGELSRTFVDASGQLHQSLARHSERVTLVVAGLGLELKVAGFKS